MSWGLGARLGLLSQTNLAESRLRRFSDMVLPFTLNQLGKEVQPL